MPRIALLILLIATAVLPKFAPASESAPPVRVLVPAYFYPAGEGLREWKRLLESASQVPIVAIVNPDSGPGKRADANYTELFRLARSSKITLVGYVTLSYGQRPLSAVKADIDSWLYFYPDVNGIFFDEQPSQPEQAAFALECFAYARTKIDQALLVTNPGTVCAREYLASRDSPVACLFEHEKGFEEYRLEEIANYFVSRSSNGRTEGFNHGLRSILWRAFGLRNFQHFRLRVLDAFGQPRPQEST